MKLIVCIKQVPAGQDAVIDKETGLLVRDGVKARMNPYDLFAIEAALRVREKTGAELTAVTMGPLSAEAVVREAYSMGVPDGALVTDSAFAGGDVFCTAYTLAQAVKSLGGADIIFCGRQTTDGDTAQTGPALAAHLGLPCLSWVQAMDDVGESFIRLGQKLTEEERRVNAKFPCVIAVDRGDFQPRLPSLKLKLAAKKMEIRKLSINDMEDTEEKHYGVKGSPTSVVRVFSPERVQKGVWIEGGLTEMTVKVAGEIEKYIV